MVLEFGDIIAISNVVTTPIFGDKSVELKNIITSSEYKDLYAEVVKSGEEHKKIMDEASKEAIERDSLAKIEKENIIKVKEAFGQKTISDELAKEIKGFSMKYTKEVEDGKTSVMFDDYVIFSKLANQN